MPITDNTSAAAANTPSTHAANRDADVCAATSCSGGAAPKTTNNKVANNTISSVFCFHNPIYQVGVADVGNNDKIITNTISGAGILGCSTTFNPSGLAVTPTNRSRTGRRFTPRSKHDLSDQSQRSPLSGGGLFYFCQRRGAWKG